MEHIHTLHIDFTAERHVACLGCDEPFRLAKYDEAAFIQMAGGVDGCVTMVYNQNGVIIVPESFSIFQES